MVSYGRRPPALALLLRCSRRISLRQLPFSDRSEGKIILASFISSILYPFTTPNSH